jgi:hypothetical protein
VAGVDVSERRWSWAGGELHVVSFGDEVVAFHESTASTHLFDEDTHRVVEALRLGECDVNTVELWQRTFGASPSESERQALDASLGMLLHAGLVTAPPS